jgi:hypothetical protein
MADRLDAVGGELHVESGPGRRCDRHRQGPGDTMTPRTATWISRGVIALALVMIAISVVVSHATAPRANPHEIVVVPQELTSRVLAAADALRGDPNAPTDPALADAPDVMLHEQDRVALGRSSRSSRTLPARSSSCS